MDDPLSQKFAALADPTRRAMISRLAKGQASVSEIAEPFLDRMSLPAVTKHLKVLERAGLISKTHDAQRRLCDLNPHGFKDAAEFLEQYRAMWETSLDRLGDYLESLKAKTKTKPMTKPKTIDKPASGKKSNGRKK